MSTINVNFDGGSALPEFPKFSHAKLTQTENEVLNLLVAGHSREEIARERGFTHTTANTHCYNIYRKLGVDDRGQIISLAARSVLSEHVRASFASPGHSSPLLPIRVRPG